MARSKKKQNAEIPQRLLYLEHYSDSATITDTDGFEAVEIPGTAILLDYAEKLKIPHWADSPKASREFTLDVQREFARRIVASYNICQGIPIKLLEMVGKQRSMASMTADTAAAIHRAQQLGQMVEKLRAEVEWLNNPTPGNERISAWLAECDKVLKATV